MTKDEYLTFMTKLKTIYPAGDWNNEPIQNLWFSYLSQYKTEIVYEAVKRYAGVNKFPPTIADINTNCKAIQNEQYEFWRRIQEIYTEVHGYFPTNLWSNEDYRTFQLKIAECKFENACLERAKMIRDCVSAITNFEKPFKEYIEEWKPPKNK